MKVVVKDSNVFIDLYEAGHLDLLFQQGWEVLTSPFVPEELGDEAQHLTLNKHISEGDISCPDFDSDEISTIGELYGRYKNISFTDSSLLYLAKSVDAVLLTGDQALRSAAESNSVDTVGTLGLYRIFIESGYLSREKAIDAIKKLRESGRRLPDIEL